MKRIILALTLLFLTACATPEQAAENRRLQAEADANTCMSYDLRPGSEAFGNCRLQLDLSRQQRYYHYYDPYPRFYGGYHHYIR